MQNNNFQDDSSSPSTPLSQCDCGSIASQRQSRVWSIRLLCCPRNRCCSSVRVVCSGKIASVVPPRGSRCYARRIASLGPAEMRSLRGSGTQRYKRQISPFNGITGIFIGIEKTLKDR